MRRVLLFRRSNFDLPAMSACDFGRDVEAETEASVRRAAAKKRLKELSHDNWVDRLTLVRDRQLETLFIGGRQHADGLIRGTRASARLPQNSTRLERSACRLDVEFPAGQQPESNFVTNGAGNPTILRYPRYCGESHPSRAANLLPKSMRPHRLAKLRKYQPPGRHRAWRAAKEFSRSLACLSAADASRTSPKTWNFCTFLKAK
jgi:hypothetical protein